MPNGIPARVSLLQASASSALISGLLLCPALSAARGPDVPDYQAEVKRHEKVTVRGLNLKGEEVEIEAEGLLAIVLQHEIDHLKGLLFIDRLSKLKRDLYKRRVRKKLAKEQS